MTGLDSILQRRGILEAARAAGWQEQHERGAAGWRYPVTDQGGRVVTHRWKAAAGTAGRKYLWLPNKPAGAVYYMPAGVERLRAAIRGAGGVIWIANGEPSALSYAAAGLDNVFCWFGESSVPKTLADDLAAWGVTEARYAADKDEAGRKSAVKVRDALRSSEIEFKALQWGDLVPDKGDANDFWQALEFDRDAFQQGLTALTALLLPSGEREGTRHDVGVPPDETPAGLVEEIGRMLGAAPPKDNGWSRRNLSSPFRADNVPSAGFNWHSGVLHDFGTGESTGPRALAEHFGIDWREYYPRRERLQRPKRAGRRPANMQRKPNAAAGAQHELIYIPDDQGGGCVCDVCGQTWAHGPLNMACPGAPETLQDMVQPVEVPAFAADATIAARYVTQSNLSPTAPGHLALKSPTGSGKTEFVRQVIEAARSDGKTVCYVSPLQALNANAANRLGLQYYKVMAAAEFGAADYLAITPNSLHKIGEKTYDVVIFDEVTLTLEALVDGPMTGPQAQGAYAHLKSLVTAADRVIMLDAHMTNGAVDWLRSVTGQAVLAVENVQTHRLCELTLHSDKSTVIRAAMREMERGRGPVVIVSDSKEMIIRVHRLLAEQFGSDDLMLVHGDNSQNEEQREFIQNINSRLPGLRALCCSPSLGTGIDVTTDVAGVFGLFVNHPVTPAQMVQAVRRYRNTRAAAAWVQRKLSPSLPTDENELVNLLKARIRSGAAAAGAQDAPTAEQWALLRLKARIEAGNNIQRRDGLSHFVALAKAEGFQIAYRDAPPAHHINKALAELAERIEQETEAAVLAAQPVSSETIDALKAQGVDITPEHLHGLQKYQIEYYATWQPLTAEHYRDLKSAEGRRRAQFRGLLINAHTTSPGALKQADQTEIDRGVLLHKRKNISAQERIFDSLARALYGMSGYELTQIRDPEDAARLELSKEELEARLAPWLEEQRDAIRQHIDWRQDLSDAAIPTARRVLKRFGLNWQAGKQRRVGANGEKVNVYPLDLEFAEKWEGYGLLWLAAALAREEFEVNEALSNFPIQYTDSYQYREIRQPAPTVPVGAGGRPPDRGHEALDLGGVISDADKL